MRFYENLKDMINGNHEPSSWQSCGQMDEICVDTHFIVATTMINTGFMCGGDGCVFGEWAWFNNVSDLIDYVTNYAIPFNLCNLEDQDPRVVMTGNGDEHIFDLLFDEAHIAIMEEQRRLWKELRVLKDNGATFAQVEAALAESEKLSNAIDGEVVFGFTCFDSRRAACEELLRIVNNPFDENRKNLVTIMECDFAGKDDGVFLQKMFVNYPLE